jgi:BCCT family betaine/carnitine transporter
MNSSNKVLSGERSSLQSTRRYKNKGEWFPDVSEAALEALYGFIANEFGILYLLASVTAIGFLVWLGFSRYGKARLGEPDETPEFREISWVGMLFCAGVGAGLLYWCVTEWAFYYAAPPFGEEWASTYGLFHWGFTAWAFYCLPTIAIAYPYYTKKLDILRFSVSCHWFLKDNDHGPLARTIDFLFMIALLGGAASSLGFSTPMIAACLAWLSLGFSTPMIAACLAWLFGIETGDTLEIGVVMLCMFLFALSVWLGLKKGIKRLSDINVLLAFALLLFIFVAGPTAFLLKTGLNSLGLMADNDRSVYGIRLRRELDNFLLGVVDRVCPVHRPVRYPNLAWPDDSAGDFRHARLGIAG